MKRSIFYLFVIGFLGLSSASLAQTVEHGHESKKGELDYKELVKYHILHPEKLKKVSIEEEDEVDMRPPAPGIYDSTKMRFYIPKKSGPPTPYMPVSPSPTDTFESTLDNSTVIPPDTHGAVDSNYCVTTINSTVKIQTRAGGAVSSVSLNSFFSSVNPANGVFDPRAHYDPYANKWFIVAVSGANNSSDTTSILIAVSKTSNPTGSWWMYRVRAFTAATYWLDFPDVGFNGKWVTITGNLFQNSPGTGYGGAKVFVFDKSALMAGTGATYTAFTQSSSFTICPAMTYSSSLGSMFAVESWNGTVGAVHLWKITGAVGSESMSAVGFPISGNKWWYSSHAFSGTTGADFAPQASTSNKVQTNDDRVDQVVFMNNYLWFAQTVFLPYSSSANPTRASIQWWQIDTLGNPNQVGLIDDASGSTFYAFPSVAVNTNNDALVGFSTFSSSTYPSAAYALRLSTDAADSMRTPVVYRHGLNSYYKTYSGTKNRWGDYSSAVLDPINQQDFWTIQEAASSTANIWDTYWAHVTVCQTPPSITGTASVCVSSSTTLSDATTGGTWTSSNTSIATVGSSSGSVSGVAAGTATITYSVSGGCYNTAVVTVNALPAAISGTKSVCVGATTGLSDGTGGGTWLSSNTGIATISGGGLVSGVAQGTSTITYTLSTGCNITAVVTVNPLPGTITGTGTVCVGSSTSLTDAGGGTWTSGSTSIATVVLGTGVVSGAGSGTTTITYTLGTGCTATTVVTVNPLPSAISGTPIVCVGLSTTLSDAGGGTWTSNNTSIATVVLGTGLLAGVAGGTTTITYTLSTGCATTTVATVNPLPSAISGATSVCVGSSTTLSDAGGGTWTSSNTSVATVILGSGVVNGVASGTATITYTLSTGCLITSVMTVNALPGSITGTSNVCVGATTALTDAGGGTWSSSSTSIATVVSGTGVVSGVASGTATITYTLGVGCTATTPVTVNPLPSAISGTPNVCVGATTALTDAGGGTWASSNTTVATISGGGLVSGLVSGTTTITYTLSTGCFITTPVTVNPLPSAIGGTLSVCVSGTTTLSDAGGGTWSSGSTSVATVVPGTGVVSGVAPGTATMTYTLGTGCQAFAVVTVNPLPSAISGTPVVCAGLSATLSDAGGGTWSSNNTSIATIVSGSGLMTGVVAGTTTITYTLPTGCVATVLATVNPLPSAISGTTSVCVGLNTTLSDAGGGTWASSNTSIATVGSGTGLVNGVVAGTATVTYTLATGCLTTTAVTVNALPSAITGVKTVCAGLTTTLSNTGGGTWTSGSTSVATIGLGTGIVTGVAAGTSTVTYTAGAGCTVTTVVTVNPLPSAISGSGGVCAGLTTTLSDAGGGTWSSSNTGVATIGSSSGFVSGLLAGTTTITYTISTGCVATTVFTVNPLPSAISGASSVCNGFTTTLSDAGGGTWSSSNTSVATIGSSSGLVSGMSVGTTVITYSLPTTCFTSMTMSVNLVPSAITGTFSVCAGGNASLSDANTGGAWSISNTSVATINSVSGLLTGVAAGTATATYALGGGCTATATVTVNPLPSAISGTLTVCAGLTTALSDAGGGTWASGNTSVATVSGVGLVSGVAAGTAVITYALPTGCIATAVTTVNALPAAISGAPVVCKGLSTTLSDAGGGTWSSSNTSVATIVSGSGFMTGVAAGTSTITYTLSTGCITVVTATVNPLPSAITGTMEVCAGLTTALTDAGGGAWSSSNTSVATVSGLGVVTGVASGTSAITYTLPTGCIAVASVTVDPLPGVISGTLSVCEGLTTSLSDAGGGTWSSGNTSVATIVSGSGLATGVLAGTAAITYTLPTGCITVSVLTVNSLPAAISGATEVCALSSITLSDAGGGSWSSGNTAVATISPGSGVLSGVAAGTVSVTYTLSTGCIATTMVTVDPLPAAITGLTHVCETFTTTLSDATGTGTWSSSNTSIATIDVSGMVSGIVAGTSTISYTLPTGCYMTSVFTVDALPGAVTGVFTVCPTSTTALTDAGGGSWTSGNTAVATVGPGSGIVTGVSAGTSVITYTLPAGCTALATVTVIGLPVVPAITGAGAVCESSLITLSDALSGGVWSSGSTVTATVSSLGVVNGVLAGVANISYSATNVCGTTSAVHPVTVNPLPVVAAITGTLHTCISVSAVLSDATPSGVWSSSNTSVATVSSSGVAMGVAAGTATTSYTVTTGFGCVAGVAAVFTVNPPLPVTITPASSTTFCTGGYVMLNATTGSGFLYQWQNGGIDIPGATSSGYLVNYSGNFTVVITGIGICRSVSSPVVVTVNPLPVVVPGVSIGATPDSVLCVTTSSVTFTPFPVNGGFTPSYEWYVNGTAVSTSPSYTYSPASGDAVRVKMLSSDGCAFPDTAISVTHTFITPLMTPSVSIIPDPSDSVCAGTYTKLTASPLFGGTAPVYVWNRNGVNVSTGVAYSYIPVNGDIIVCSMTSNYTCLTGPVAVSSPITMYVSPVSANTDSIYLTTPKVANGVLDTFVAIALHGGAAPGYQWYINGVAIPGATNATYVTNVFVDGDVVTCAVTSSDPCAFPKTGSGNKLKMHVPNGSASVIDPDNNVWVSPNPNDGEFDISGKLKDLTDDHVNIVITDMLGQVVMKKKVTMNGGLFGEHVILNKTLANAMYLVKVSYGDEFRVFHVVVKR